MTEREHQSKNMYCMLRICLVSFYFRMMWHQWFVHKTAQLRVKIPSELNPCCNDDHTYPFIDVHLQCAIVEREEICMRAAGCIAQFMLQEWTQTDFNQLVQYLQHRHQWKLILTVILSTHHFEIGFTIEGCSKDRHDKDINEEGDEKSDRWLNEEILVGFLYFVLIVAINFTRLLNENIQSYTHILIT